MFGFGVQLAELVKCGFLKDYLLEKQAGQSSGSQPAGGEGQQHEVPIHGEIHTVAGGFSGGGCTASQRKKYARSVMSVEVFEDHSPDVDITFTKDDLMDVVPHDNDPIVISLVTAGRTVHRVLVDQGSSADVMFWPTFKKLQLSPDQLRPYGGCLYENSLKNKRFVCHVSTTPPPGVEPERESRRDVDMALKEVIEGDVPDVPMKNIEARSEGATRAEEERSCPETARESGIAKALIASEKRPQPVEEWLEKKINGKTFKLVKTLDSETQDQIARVISRHLDAFAWSASCLLYTSDAADE